MITSFVVREVNSLLCTIYHTCVDIVANGAEVTFTSSDPELLPLPKPSYLAFHASLAKVVHMAGMAEYLDDILRRYEEIRVLSDESGTEYLDRLLRVAQR